VPTARVPARVVGGPLSIGQTAVCTRAKLRVDANDTTHEPCVACVASTYHYTEHSARPACVDSVDGPYNSVEPGAIMPASRVPARAVGDPLCIGHTTVCNRAKIRAK
jgi:hypothetical protein